MVNNYYYHLYILFFSIQYLYCYYCPTEEDCIANFQLCEIPTCYDGYIAAKLPCVCCEMCIRKNCPTEKECEKIKCGDTECNENYILKKLPCECCPRCLPLTCKLPTECANVTCPKLSCKYWQQIVYKKCECCPVCDPQECANKDYCELVHCELPSCSPNEVLIKFPCVCCPFCLNKRFIRKEYSFFNYGCKKLVCKPGYILRKLFENRCPECVPEDCIGGEMCDKVFCEKIVCNQTSKLVNSLCQCCPYCQMFY